MSALTTIPPSLHRKFRSLTDEWRAATQFAAAPSAAVEHPSYQALIDLGAEVVPLILEALAEAPDPWFAALRELTGADPVPAADRGRPRAAADHWLAWGHAHGLVAALRPFSGLKGRFYQPRP